MVDSNQILHVVVVGFHHKRGCQVDFIYPPFEGQSIESLPPEWTNLPSLAIPDGAHNVDQDIIYFLLPSHDEPGKSVFAISCYRQIAAEELKSRSDDVTRSTVQKSVVVLSRRPLFGVLKAKLQLITQAYFNERDFTKVEVLSQMYGNLCEMFEGDLVDGQSAIMDISVRDLVKLFKHRVVQLFKLILLERKVVFYMFPVQKLGDTILALLSLFPELMESGLFYASPVMSSTCSTPENAEEAKEEDVELAESAIEREEKKKAEKQRKEVEEAEEVKEHECAGEEKEQSDSVEVLSVPSSPALPADPLGTKDSFGFPLSIYTLGNVFLPYTGINILECLRSRRIRGYTIGTTNQLFVQRKDYHDALVTIDESGDGMVEILNADLKKQLTLTTADLRFADYLIKNVESTEDQSAEWDGSDEWIRVQFRSYLLSMISSVRSDLSATFSDFSTPFVMTWRETVNFRRLVEGKYPDLVAVPPGHAFAGQLGVYDVMLRVEHSVGGSEQAKKALNVLSSTGRQLGETGGRVRNNITQWFKGVTQSSAGQNSASPS